MTELLPPAYLVAGTHTPFARRGGAFATTHPADLAGAVIVDLIKRAGVDADRVDDVIFGCVNQIGPQTSCIARTAWLSAGLPTHVPGVTVDRRCGSSLQTVHFAAQAVQSGRAEMIVAGGVESMSLVRIGSPRRAIDPEGGGPYAGPFATRGWVERFGPDEPSQFVDADLVAERWALQREDLDDVVATSHHRADTAWSAGRFDDEVAPFGGLDRDEGVRTTIDRQKIAGLLPLRPGGANTAAMASQISDGAAAVLVASEATVERYALTPLARFHTLTVAADDPVVMLTAPIAATRRAFERSGLTAADIGVTEINEAFASVVLSVQGELGLDPAVVNPNGGAIAIGHPLGATGARLVISLALEMALELV